MFMRERLHVYIVQVWGVYAWAKEDVRCLLSLPYLPQTASLTELAARLVSSEP